MGIIVSIFSVPSYSDKWLCSYTAELMHRNHTDSREQSAQMLDKNNEYDTKLGTEILKIPHPHFEKEKGVPSTFNGPNNPLFFSTFSYISVSPQIYLSVMSTMQYHIWYWNFKHFQGCNKQKYFFLKHVHSMENLLIIFHDFHDQWKTCVKAENVFLNRLKTSFFH